VRGVGYFAWIRIDLAAAATVSILQVLCHLDRRVSIQGMCALIKSPISRGRHGEEGEKGKEGYSDEEGRQEDERQKEEITGATSLRAAQPYRHLKRHSE